MVSNALIVGGGIGGLAAAAALAQRGMAVTLVEQAEAITEVGAGIQVSPNGVAVLRALGLSTALKPMGAVQARAVQLCDHRAGKTVATFDLTKFKDQQYYFLHRADLVGLLARAARQANVSFEFGRRVSKISPGPISEVLFDDGATSRAELVVCADGVRSVGRMAVNGHAEARFTGQVAWRALIPARSGDPVATVTMGPGRHIVSYPIRDGKMTNIVAVQERDTWADEGWHHKDDPAHLRAAFADFGDPMRALLDRVDDAMLWGLFRHPVADTWFEHGCVLIGDAAHPTLPFLAQGANLALEDAWVLADTVAQSDDLALYQAKRQDRVRRVVDAASGNARKYHLKPGPLRTAAHLALSLGSRTAPGLMMKQLNWIYGHDVTKN